MGSYTLEYAAHNGRPVFRQLPTECFREPTPGKPDELLVRCVKRHNASAYVYYESDRGYWELGMGAIGAPNANMLAQAGEAASPELVPPGKWSVADKSDATGWRVAPKVRFECVAAGGDSRDGTGALLPQWVLPEAAREAGAPPLALRAH